MNVLSTRIVGMAKRLLVEQDPVDQELSSHDVIDAILAAKEEWLAAREYFDNATDPDLIDHAIFSIEAAERKYMYLLKQAKDKGVFLNDTDFLNGLH